MLIDTFSRRYKDIPLRHSYEQRDAVLLTQAFRILSEDLCPYYQNGHEAPAGVKFWTDLHERISRELGLNELSPGWSTYVTKWNGNDHFNTSKIPMVTRCKNWLLQKLSGSPDVHIKDRLSFIELGLRMKETEIAVMNVTNPSPLEKTYASLSGREDFAVRWREEKTASFREAVNEVNVRFRQADYDLNYHNGFIQLSNERLIQEEIENPFWSLVSEPMWRNVDLDMKEALDLRDTDGRDPAFYAARSLESTIKIISDKKGWTTGKERGANNYVDNLASKANGMISRWESESLKGYFTHVRNPLGHGPGSDDMPALSRPQTDWAIEFAMIWIKSLVSRI
jgi:hypothetical protein